MFCPLTPSHTAEVTAIARLSFPKPWTEKDFDYFLAHACGCGWGAFRTPSNTLVSFSIGLLVHGELDVVSVATTPSCRGKGIASRLLKHVLSLPELRHATLEVDVDNVSAISIYEKAGFQRMGVRKKYYEGVRDALFMRWSK